jgi:hypothetical protein
MTVSYSEHVFTSTFGSFVKLLFRWKGSIYKLVWRDLILYVILFSVLSVLYRFILPAEGKYHYYIYTVYYTKLTGLQRLLTTFSCQMARKGSYWNIRSCHFKLFFAAFSVCFDI